MINLMDYDYKKLIKGITYKHTIYFIKSVFETNKNFVLIKTSSGRRFVFEIMSFVKKKDDVVIELKSINNTRAVIRRSSFGNIYVFYEHYTFVISSIELLDGFDDASEYLV